MHRTKRRHPQFDALEVKALLSTVPLQIPQAAAIPVHAARVARPSQATTTPTALPDLTVRQLQATAANGNVELFMSQVAALMSSNANVQTYAQEVIADHQTSDAQDDTLARSLNVILPTGLYPSQAALGDQLIRAIGTSTFDQTYLSLMAQVNSRSITLEQQLATSSNTQVQQAAQSSLTEDQLHLSQAQALQADPSTPAPNLTPPPTATTTPPTGTSLTTADLQYMQSDASTDSLEVTLSTAAALIDSNAGVAPYAQKLVADHRMSANQLQGVASSYGVVLTAGISQAADLATARQVLAAANSSSFNQTYLKDNVTIHQADIAGDQAEATTTQNPNLQEYASSDTATATVHLQATQQLLAASNGGNGGTTLPGVVNVRHQVGRGPGLTDSLIFDAGGYTYNQQYSIGIRQTGRGGSVNGITGLQAATLFQTELLSRLNGNPASTGTSTSTSSLTLANVTNVRESLTRGPGTYFTLTFDAGGFTYTQRESIVITRTGRGRGVNGLTGLQAATLFQTVVLSDVQKSTIGTGVNGTSTTTA